LDQWLPDEARQFYETQMDTTPGCAGCTARFLPLVGASPIR
jgi:hypothetical protein